MICPNCGRETNGKFCPQCGTKLDCGDTTLLSEETNPWMDKAPIPQEAEAEPAGQPEIPQAPVQEPAAPQNQDYLPNQGSNPNPGYAPNQGYNQGYVPNQGYNPNQGYVPNQGYNPNQGYAPNPGYVPNQGYNPGGQGYGGYQTPAAALGNTPARQLVRKLGSSPAFLIGVLAATLSFVILLVRGISTFIQGAQVLEYYRHVSELRVQVISTLSGTAVALIITLVSVLFLWSIYGSAASKSGQRMSTAGLTFYKVVAILGIIAASIALVITLIVLVVVLASGADFDRIFRELSQLMAQYEIPDWGQAEGLLRPIFIGLLIVLPVAMIMALIYYAKLIKTINTSKRVILHGLPDDRISPFVGVMEIIAAVCSVLGGVSTLVKSGMNTGVILNGVSVLLSAVSAICFAVVLFRFRSGMRALGVYKGVMQQRPY